MEKESGKGPDTVTDEALDEAAGGITFGGSLAGETAAPSFLGGTTEGKAGYGGFTGGVSVAAGDVNADAVARKVADGSVKPGG